MNRLIIVENGFDLAHGMKTGYNDFMLWYLKDIYSTAYNDDLGLYEDDAFKIIADKRKEVQINKHKGVSEFIDYFYGIGALTRMTQYTTFQEEGEYMYYENAFKTVVKSPFIKTLLYTCSIINWVDIETEYYEALKQALSLGSEANEAVLTLNLSLSVLIAQLQRYLSSLKMPSSHNQYFSILASKILYDDLAIPGPPVEIPLDKTMVLNFNYTSTVERYLDPSIEINYIHGQLNDPNNPLIFGFGDELDNEYQQFELDKTQGIFKYVKSFWYFRTKNYHRLIRFIQNAKFQVVILGHSCGLSDRTMLNMIFEDENCISVKLYHYAKTDSDNYTETMYELARHFKNKQQMRKKIVPFNKDSFMPQVGV